MQKACLIIPCYNEENRFPVAEFADYYNNSQKFCFCLVNDGSSDATLKVLNELKQGREDRIRVVNMPINKGKATAIQMGVTESLKWQKFDYLGFMDADLSTPFSQMELLLGKIESDFRYDFVFGSRVKLLGNKVERKAVRHYLGRVFSTLASMVLRLPVYDTQCGAKIVKSDLVEKIFAEAFLSPWLFDVELFARSITLKGKGYAQQHMLEMPLEKWKHQQGSKLRLSALIRVPLDLFRIHLKYRKYL